MQQPPNHSVSEIVALVLVDQLGHSQYEDSDYYSDMVWNGKWSQFITK